jgi:cell division transport system permease protein
VFGQLAWLSQESVRGFRRSGGATLAATWSTALACSLLFVFLYTAQIWSDWSTREIARQGWVELFLADGTDPSTVTAAVRSVPGVQVVELLDKEQAKANFVERFGPEMLVALDSNPLPVSVRVQVAGGTSETVAAFAAKVSRIPGVEAIDSPTTNLDDLARFQSWVLRSGILAGLLLFGVVFGVIRNSIQLSLRARDRLIDNMRILGASRFQIELPFAVEGALQGLLGGLLASILPWTVLWAARTFLPVPVPLEHFWALRAGAVTLVFAGLAGLAGGWWTVRRTFR